MARVAHRYPSRRCGARLKTLLLPVLARHRDHWLPAGVLLPAAAQIQLSLSGNWQFTMAPPSDGSFLGGLQGGFLLQERRRPSTGAADLRRLLARAPHSLQHRNRYDHRLDRPDRSATKSQWTITAVAGTQTFTLTGNSEFRWYDDSGHL
jgi:hypothetical protein